MMDRILKIIKIIKFIKQHSGCSVPFIRDSLDITHSDPPSKEEKSLYKIISLLDTQGYIKKTYYKKRMIGGARFSLSLTDNGEEYFKKLGLSEGSKEEDLEQLKASINIKVQKILKGKVSRPLQAELSSALIEAISEEIDSIF